MKMKILNYQHVLKKYSHMYNISINKNADNHMSNRSVKMLNIYDNIIYNVYLIGKSSYK